MADLGPISFQPSELAKIAIVLVLAKSFSDRSENREYRLRDLWQPFVLTAIPCFLILKEPDLGTALFLGMISISVVLIAKVYWKSLIIFVCSFFLAAPFDLVRTQGISAKKSSLISQPRHGSVRGRIPHQSVQNRYRFGAVLGKRFFGRDTDPASFFA